MKLMMQLPPSSSAASSPPPPHSPSLLIAPPNSSSYHHHRHHSEDDDLHHRTTSGTPPTATTNTTSSAKRKNPTSSSYFEPPPTSADGEERLAVDASRKPRGRPPGSKNKPKPPLIITTESDDAMRPIILEIATGRDVVDSLSQFARRHRLGLCIVAASGSVANVNLRQPAAPAAVVTLHDRFDILSLSATFLPATSTPSCSGGFTISLAGGQGQVYGGSVVGALVAAGTVVIVAASFSSSSYHRLPANDEFSEQKIRSPQSTSSGGAAATATPDSCTMSVYNVSTSPLLTHHLPSYHPPEYFSRD